MPIAVHTDVEARRVLVQGSGALDDRDIETLVAELTKSEQLPEFDVLHDFREVTDVSGLSAELVRRLGEIDTCDPALASRQRIAIVANSDALFGLGRMFALGRRVKRAGVEVFRSVEDARAYLSEPGADRT